MCNRGIIIETELPKFGEIDQIMWNHQVAWLEINVYGAHGVCRNDPLDTHFKQGVDVGSVVHPVWWDGMVNSMTGQKSDRFSADLAD
jgi:hypothetical protein